MSEEVSSGDPQTGNSKTVKGSGLKTAIKVPADYVRGHNAAEIYTGRNHKLQYPERGPCEVNIIRKDLGRAGRNGQLPRGEWLIRADNPHGRAQYPHINVNDAVTGRPDPHTRIPARMPRGLKKAAKVLQKVNRGAKVVGPVLDAANLGYSGYQDYNNGTTRNTVTTAAGVAAGYGGGFAGAAAGAAVGSFFGPVGTLVGGIAGAIVGGVGGSVGGEATVDAIGDAAGYDVEERECQKCKKRFKVRRYKGEDFKECPECREHQDSE